ncbi:MAG: hypothetical protein EP346_06520 [Bacteroidetes bacterium]|nr:MAG: hypothetical protein EP346_06520 [Bacteroidota bacterium]
MKIHSLLRMSAFCLLLFPSCQSSENPNAEEVVEPTEVESVDYADNLLAHLPKNEISEHAIHASNGGKIELKSGVEIEVPKNAFADASGNLIEGTVTLYVEDMTSLSAVLNSNITMTAKSPDGTLGSFQTAGMISITSDPNITIADGKSLSIQLPADSKDDYPLWRFDTESGEWVQISASTQVSTTTTTQPSRTDKDESTVEIPPLSTAGIWDIVVDPRGQPHTCATEVFEDIFVYYPATCMSQFHNEHPVEWQEYNANNPLSIRMDISKAMTHWEFANFRPMYFSAVDEENLKRSMRLSTNYLQFRKTPEGHYEMYSYNRRNDGDSVLVEVIPNYTPNQRRHAMEVQQSMHNKWRCDSALMVLSDRLVKVAKKEYNGDKWSTDLTRTTAFVNNIINGDKYGNEYRLSVQFVLGKYPESYRRINDPAAYYAQVRRENSKWTRYSDSIREYRERITQRMDRVSETLSRNFDINTFGIFNCDRFYRVPSSDFTVQFTNVNGQHLDITYLRLIDASDNAIVDQNINNTGVQVMKLGTDTRFTFIALGSDNQAYHGEINTSNFSDSGVNSFICEPVGPDGIDTSKLVASN